MSISQERAREIALETLRILESGEYQAPSGARVAVHDDLERAIRNTVSYPPDSNVPLPSDRRFRTVIDVTPQTTLQAARELGSRGRRVAALNFANGVVPGGGFLAGALAQEESLVRSSGLFPCIAESPMYEFHRSRNDHRYTEYTIYSPDVPVFRADDGTLLEEPYRVSFLTAAAPNAIVLPGGQVDQNRAAIGRGVERVLAIAAAHGHDSLVLGAWGCGAYGNDPADVASLFKGALLGPFGDVFETVVFAIADTSPDLITLETFRRAFGGADGSSAGPRAARARW